MPYIRVLHASPGPSHVDVYADGRLIARRLPYGRHTGYFRVPIGAREISLYPAGIRVRPIVVSSVPISRVGTYTIAVSGYPGRVALLPVQERVVTVVPGQAYIRFVHLSPNTPNVDVILPDGTVLFSNIGYSARTGYIAMSPGAYTLQVVQAGTNTVLLTVPVNLAAGGTYTIYAVGLMGSSSNPLRAIITPDGSSDLPMEEM